MIVLNPGLAAMVNDDVHRFALLWRITRTDGQVYHFTNHESAIFYGNFTYVPAGGLNASARQKKDGLQDRNVETTGIINSDQITFTDLVAGKFRNAKFEEMIIDWRYPWADPFEIKTFYFTNLSYTGEIWNVQMEGLTHKLKVLNGRNFNRSCDVKTFGDKRCGKNEADFTTIGCAVTGINTSRRDFESSVPVQPTNYYKLGYLKWTTGANDNLQCDINKSYGTGSRIVLWLPTPADIQIGDTFNIVAGCDRLFSTCRDKFDNVVNFRGFISIPGTDAMLRRPARRQT